jgi:hypothetical protein
MKRLTLIFLLFPIIGLIGQEKPDEYYFMLYKQKGGRACDPYLEIDFEPSLSKEQIEKNIRDLYFYSGRYREQKYLLHLEYQRYPRSIPFRIPFDSKIHDSLDVLEIYHCDSLTDVHAKELSKLTNLKVLDIRFSHDIEKNSGGNLEHLLAIKSLKEIYLNNYVIRDEDIKSLSRIRTLTTIDSSYWQISNSGLKLLSELENLYELTISHRYYIIYENTIRTVEKGDPLNFSPLTQLRYLTLEDCKDVNDFSLKTISKLPNLKELRIINNEEITDDGVAYLKDALNIETICLLGCKNLTRKSAITLLGIKGLKSLCIQNHPDSGKSFRRSKCYFSGYAQ